MLLDSLTTTPEIFTARTGWSVRPEGLCKGDRCVPAPDALTDDGLINIEAVAQHLAMPLVTDEESGWRALGPESGGSTLTTTEVPDLTLPDADGNPFRLRSLLGRKVLLVAWASW